LAVALHIQLFCQMVSLDFMNCSSPGLLCLFLLQPREP
jgi:hypothetical protein